MEECLDPMQYYGTENVLGELPGVKYLGHLTSFEQLYY